ncbi:MAG TPA: penicillin-binding transpeptidase domain-containing protein [Ilumatobacteraceae bacterium]|nr:penicillin-binding transpeptidase domain-containing protein [Ilumatobacteraceae bacterium]
MAIDRRSARLGVLATMSLVLMSALGVRLWFLQGIQSSTYERALNTAKLRTVYVPPERGRIFDATGRVMADNREILTVTVDWAYVRRTANRDELFRRLAGILQVSEVDLQRRYNPCYQAPTVPKCTKGNVYSTLLPLPLKEDVSEDQINQILERSEDYPGVGVTTEWRRVYPYAPLASHIVGYMGSITSATKDRYAAAGYNMNERVGQFGVESSMEQRLHGKWGKIVYEIDAAGTIVREVSRENPVAGEDIQLTIDLQLQQYAEQALETQLKMQRNVLVPNNLDMTTLGRTRLYQYKAPDGTMVDFPAVMPRPAPAGAVVVEDWTNGHILAMATYPTFDNRWMEAGITSAKFAELFPMKNPDGTDIDPDKAILVNRAIQGNYNMGSSIKPFIAWAAMHSGLINANTSYNDQGTYTLRSIDLSNCQHKGGTARCIFKNAISSGTNKPAVYGPVNVEQALAVSSDAFFYNLGEEFWRVDKNLLKADLMRFGFGMKSGIQLPYEWAGRIPDDAVKKQLIDTGKFGKNEVPRLVVGDNVQVAIGQGLMAATPIQAANAYATLANGGVMLQPTIVKNIFAPLTPNKSPAVADLERATVVESFDVPKARDELEMPGEVRDPIVRGLRRVIRGPGVDYQGYHSTTGQKIFATLPKVIDAYGKTGTAQGFMSRPWLDSSAFGSFVISQEHPIATFAYLEKAGYGSQAAAPVTKCLYLASFGLVEMDPVVISNQLDINSTEVAPAKRLANNSCLAPPGGFAVRD